MTDSPVGVEPRWLVTINGRVVTAADMDALGQGQLAAVLRRSGLGCRSEFERESYAVTFGEDCAREFPWDAVCLWASVDRS